MTDQEKILNLIDELKEQVQKQQYQNSFYRAFDIMGLCRDEHARIKNEWFGRCIKVGAGIKQ